MAVLAATALPILGTPARRVARLDAVQALMRLQAAQEQHRALHGLYASDLQPLRGVTERSPQGLYRLSLKATGRDAYRASASAIASGSQASDTICATLTLDVHLGFAQEGPSPACWNR